MTTNTTFVWPIDLARRYRRDPITVWRWQRNGKLPPPDIEIGGRKGWRLSTIEDFERASTRELTP